MTGRTYASNVRPGLFGAAVAVVKITYWLLRLKWLEWRQAKGAR